jgi:hypothetical protein
LRDWISFLSPLSALAAALATRVADLEALRDPYELNSVPLLRGSGKPFEIEPFSQLKWRHSSFMTSKSRVTDGPAGGVVLQLSERALFFLGIREDLLVIAADQKFEEIIEYKAEAGSQKKTVKCTFNSGRYMNLKLPESVSDSVTETGGYIHFNLTGVLNYSPEGLVFGTLPLPEK